MQDRIAAFTISGTSDGAPARLQFTEVLPLSSPVSIFSWGTVRVDLGAVLFNRWTQAGRPGTGVVAETGNMVRLLSSAAQINSLPLAPTEFFTIKVTTQPNASSSLPARPHPDAYRLDATQLAERFVPPPPAGPAAVAASAGLDVVGGMRFVFKTKRPFVPPAPPPQ
jgi:hypothetical protein